MATKKITIELEVPESAGAPRGLEEFVRDIAERIIAYLILSEKANAGVDESEVAAVLREVRREVWERVKHAYTKASC